MAEPATAFAGLLPAALEGAPGWLTAGAPEFEAARWLFLRALGLVYLIAFGSLWSQVEGLFGARGILPVAYYLDGWRDFSPSRRYRQIPTLFWFDDSDRALHLACGVGVLASLLLVLGVAPVPVLLLLWALYLSFAAAGQAFLSYQWDVLLLEAGFVSLFLAPWELLPSSASAPAPPRVAVLMIWWLLFRLVFQSGVGKLRSGDSTWRDLSALEYHYWTQPLPAWTSWYAARLPPWFHRLSTLLTHVLEIGWPLLIFGSDGMRLAAFAGIVFLQIVILATGNYNFFNLLTIALAFLLLPAPTWPDFVPAAGATAADPSPPPAQVGLTLSAAVPYFLLSGAKVWRTLFPDAGLPTAVAALVRWTEPFRTVNSYGLFRVMTTRRPEIVVEGSHDGDSWKAYEFKYKPGDLARAPPFVQPHQPRLDWQMWFAALSNFRQATWFRAFLVRLLEGSESVERLLESTPFGERPPRFVRAVLYEYRFTDPEERRRTGRWWKRRRVGMYAPPMTRSTGRQ